MEALGVEAGQVVADKYRLDELLGCGGMGSVWRAEHLSLQSPVAVKILKPAVAGNPNSRARFLQEAKAAARLRSPHVVQILDHGTDGALAFITMELLDGESLQARLKREHILGTALTATIATHVGRAIGRAHEEGIVHRDLKPDNVFLVPNEDELIAKVLDFGIAKTTLAKLSLTGSPQTKTGTLLGTPFYMSPEQAAGDKTVDHRSDLWALGVITFECLCGRRPFQSEALGDLVLQICAKPIPIPSQTSQVPPGFDEWFARATDRDQARRFQGAREMTLALRTVLLAEDPPTRRMLSDPGVERDAPAERADGPARQTAASTDAASTGSVSGADDPDLARPGVPWSAEQASGPTLLSSEGAAGPTFEPLASETRPRRKRRVMLGAVLAMLGLALGAVIAFVVLRPAAQTPLDDAARAGAQASEDLPSVAPPISAATTSKPDDEPPVPSDAGEPSATASAATSAPPRTPVLRPRPRPGQPARPKSTATEDDPLGI